MKASLCKTTIAVLAAAGIISVVAVVSAQSHGSGMGRVMGGGMGHGMGSLIDALREGIRGNALMMPTIAAPLNDADIKAAAAYIAGL